MNFPARSRSAFAGILAFVTIFLSFYASDACKAALLDALNLCTSSLLFSIFPFLILSSLICRCGAEKALGLPLRPLAALLHQPPEAAACLLLGAVGGFAPAANAVGTACRSGSLSPRQAQALLPACICSGPAFVILSVGQDFLGSRAVGFALFASQLLACWCCGLLFRVRRGASPSRTSLRRAPSAVPAAAPAPFLSQIIGESAVSYLKLCGCILYFRFLAGGCAAFLPQRLSFLPAMLLEVSSGCRMAASSGPLAAALCCAVLSLQGISIFMQVRTLCPVEISLAPLLLARLLHLPLSLLLFRLFLYFAPAAAVYSSFDPAVPILPMRRASPEAALTVFAACCFLAARLCRTLQAPEKKL